MPNVTTPSLDDVLAVIRKDLDPATLAIVEEMIHDGHRLTVIRDAFAEEKDALAVKMIRDLDPMRKMELLPISCDLRNRQGSGPEGVAPGGYGQIIARPQRGQFRPRYLVLAKATAEALDIADIHIGNRSQFLQSGEIPGEMFAVDVPEASLDMLATAEGPNARDPVYTLHIGARAVERLPLPINFEIVGFTMDLVVTFANISDRPLARFRGAFVGVTGNES
jgi:hypothetical protein